MTSETPRKSNRPTSGKRHSELTDAEKKKYGAPHIGTLFSHLNSELNEIWEDYVAVNFYLAETHKRLKAGKIDRVVVPRLVQRPRTDPLNPNAIYGIISRIRSKSAGRHAFIDAIGLFEHFISMLVFKVYLDFPRKLRGLSSQSEAEGRQQKLLEVIFDSSDRNEMIHKLVEERVRGIFYGNPIDLFVKDKAAIAFETHFKDNKKASIEALAEIIARRNIIVHNQGRVDRKYLNEVSAPTFKQGAQVQIDQEYLRRALFVMKDVAADAAQLVATNIYKEPLFGKAKKIQVSARKTPVK